MRPRVKAPSEIPSFHWQPPGVPVEADFSLAVLGAVRQRLTNPPAETPRGEFGGILLGSATKDDHFQTRIEAFEPFEIEYRHGAGFTLSMHDQKRLRQRLARWQRARLKPVGFYRSHLRRGLYLDQRDFDLFRSEFRHPASVFLLVRPEKDGTVTGGLFIWEDEDIRRHAPYQSFSVEAYQQPAPAVEPQLPKLTALPKLPALPQLPALPRLPTLPTHWARSAVVVLLCVALPLGGFYLGRRVALRDRQNNDVAETHRSPAPTPSPPLVQPQPQPAMAMPQPPVPAPPVEQKPSPLAVPEPSPRPAVTARNSRERTGPPVVITRERRPAAESLRLPDPPEVTSEYKAPAFPTVLSSRPTTARSTEHVVAYMKPRSSAIKRTLSRVFGGGKRNEEYVPANAIEHPMPSIAADDAEKPLEMAAKIDRDGRVISVKTVQGNSKLASACANALYKWKFDPARQNGDPVESEMLVRFEFSGTAR